MLGRVITGREPGRTNDDQVIAFMNKGRGHAVRRGGGMLYDLACKRGLGTQAPAEWFHQDKKYIP
jgi:hypothetical protein